MEELSIRDGVGQDAAAGLGEKEGEQAGQQGEDSEDQQRGAGAQQTLQHSVLHTRPAYLGSCGLSSVTLLSNTAD